MTILIILAIVGYVFILSPNEDETLVMVSFRVNDQEVLNITCEITSTHEEQLQGLMYREELAMDRGMLFIYDSPEEVHFWMKNTLIPLDMIFIDESGIVTNVEEADVETGVPENELTRYSSDGPIKWVVEINQGICALNGIDTGTQIIIHYSWS